MGTVRLGKCYYSNRRISWPWLSLYLDADHYQFAQQHRNSTLWSHYWGLGLRPGETFLQCTLMQLFVNIINFYTSPLIWSQICSHEQANVRYNVSSKRRSLVSYITVTATIQHLMDSDFGFCFPPQYNRDREVEHLVSFVTDLVDTQRLYNSAFGPVNFSANNETENPADLSSSSAPLFDSHYKTFIDGMSLAFVSRILVKLRLLSNRIFLGPQFRCESSCTFDRHWDHGVGYWGGGTCCTHTTSHLKGGQVWIGGNFYIFT